MWILSTTWLEVGLVLAAQLGSKFCQASADHSHYIHTPALTIHTITSTTWYWWPFTLLPWLSTLSPGTDDHSHSCPDYPHYHQYHLVLMTIPCTTMYMYLTAIDETGPFLSFNSHTSTDHQLTVWSCPTPSLAPILVITNLTILSSPLSAGHAMI